MTRRDIARMRAAAHAAVDKMFDDLESSQPANTVVREPALPPSQPVSELAKKRAERIIRRHGINT